MLIDSVEITVRAGRGGDGIVAWRREKYVPHGGPDGGDGGRGGDVYLIGSNNVDTLSSFRYRKVFQAADGENGRHKRQHGRSGENLELLVPLGTVVMDAETGKVLADITENSQRFLVAKGGAGGLGNVHFATATNQKPVQQTDGEPGEVKKLKLELRLIADAALVGKPNAGKSSIISALSGAHSQIGAYAFSTTQPILGVMRTGSDSITLVDLPGLVEGAHRGKGLGDKFLQHLRRVKIIIHVIDSTEPIINDSISQIETELKKYEPALLEKPRILVFNKIDLLTPEEISSLKEKFPQALYISAQEKINLNSLRQALTQLPLDN
jgi:GTP-binding protein